VNPSHDSPHLWSLFWGLGIAGSAVRELDGRPLHRRRQFERKIALTADGFVETIKCIVAVGRVVVERNQATDFGGYCEVDALGNGAMSPADVAGVLLGGELGVVNENVGAQGQVDARDPGRVRG
jgi:hypothetical protein